MSFTYFPAAASLSTVDLTTLAEIHAIELAVATASHTGQRMVIVRNTAMTENDSSVYHTINFDVPSSTILHTAHNFTDGTPVRLNTTGLLPYPLTTIRDYYVITVDANSYKLADKLDNVTLNITIPLYGSVAGVSSIKQESTGMLYYSVLHGTVEDIIKYDQVSDVVGHFSKLSYNIQLLQDSTGVFWLIKW